MSETEKDVIEILTSQPRSHTPWALAAHSINIRMGWSSPNIMVFVEHLMEKNVIVLRSEAVHKDDPRKLEQSWWVRV